MNIVGKHIHFYCFGRLRQLNSLKEVIISMSERYEYGKSTCHANCIFIFVNKKYAPVRVCLWNMNSWKL